MQGTKLSQITDGNAVDPDNDQVVTVRGGANDVLARPGLAGGATPAAVAGLGAGNGAPVVTVAGGALAGTVTVLTNGAMVGSAAVATVTYGVAAPNGSAVMLTPANAAAQGAGVFTQGGTDNWTLGVAAAPLTTNTTYVWNYQAVKF